jgi:hypothetical protein
MTDKPRLTKRSCTPELASVEQLQILLVAKQKRIVKKTEKKKTPIQTIDINIAHSSHHQECIRI